MPLGYQVVLRAKGDRVLAPTDGARRGLVGALLRVGRDKGIFGVGAADTHAHALLAGDEAQVGRFVHDAKLALSATLELGIGECRVTEVRDIWHAEQVLAYVHRQDAHHGVASDPCREATTLPDLLGLRWGQLWVAQRVRAVVPRVTRADLLAHWGLPTLAEGFDLRVLAEAGAAAAGLARLSGRSEPVVMARRACVAAAGGLPTEALAAALGVAARTVRHLRGEEVSPLVLRAVRLQMGLRMSVRRAEPFSEAEVSTPVVSRHVGNSAEARARAGDLLPRTLAIAGRLKDDPAARHG